MIPAEKLASLEATAKADLPLMHLDALEILAEIRRLQAAVGIAREEMAQHGRNWHSGHPAGCMSECRLICDALKRIDEVLR